MAERLRATLAPTRLEVLDESWQHEGHAGANGTGFGTHFRVRIASPCSPESARWRSTGLCMMRYRFSSTMARTPSPLKLSDTARLQRLACQLPANPFLSVDSQ